MNKSLDPVTSIITGYFVFLIGMIVLAPVLITFLTAPLFGMLYVSHIRKKYLNFSGVKTKTRTAIIIGALLGAGYTLLLAQLSYQKTGDPHSGLAYLVMPLLATIGALTLHNVVVVQAVQQQLRRDMKPIRAYQALLLIFISTMAGLLLKFST